MSLYHEQTFIQPPCVLKIQFPSDYVGLMKDQSLSCNSLYGLANPSQLACAMQGGPQSSVIISGGFPSQYMSLAITLNSIQNFGSQKQSGFFTLTSQNSQGNSIIDTSAQNQFFVQTKASQLIGLSMTNSRSIVGEDGDLTISTRTANPIPQNGQLVMTFPKWNPNSLFNKLSYFSSLPVSSNNQLGCGNILNLSGTMVCSLIIGPNFDTLVVTSGFPSGLASGSLIQFKVNSVKGPPSMQPVNSFILSTTDTASNLIDTLTGGNYVATQPGQIPTSNFNVLPLDSNQTNAFSTYLISLKFKNPCPQGSLIYITFPPEVGFINSSTGALYLTQVTISGKQQGQLNFVVNQKTDGINQIKISDAAQSYINEGSTIFLTFTQLLNPVSTAPTGTFKYELWLDNQYQIEYLSSQVNLNFASAPISAASLSLNNYTVFNSPTTANISFIYTGALPAGSQFEVEYPSQVSIGNFSPSCVVIIQGNTYNQGTCQNVALQSKLIFASYLLKGLPFAQNLAIELTISGITNPTSELQTSSFAFNIKDQQGYLISSYDKGQLNFSPLLANLYTGLANSNSLITGAIATYTIQFDLPAGMSIEKGSLVLVQFPKDIQLPKSFGCFSGSSANLQCSNNSLYNSTITIQDMFSSQTVSGPTKIQFSISNIQNPLTTKQTSSFAVLINSSQNKGILRLTSGMTIQMNKGSPFQSIQVSNNDYLLVKFPNEVKLASSSYLGIGCVGNTNLSPTLNCYFQQGSIYIQLKQINGQSIFDSGTPFQFTINSIKNPPTTKKSGSFTIQTITNDQLYAISYQDQNITVTNTEAGQIVRAEAYAVNPVLGQPSAYMFTLTPINPLPINSLIKVFFPSEIKYQGSASCKSYLGLGSSLVCAYTNNDNSFTISTNLDQDQTSPTVLKFSISSFINPNTPTIKTSFKVQTTTYDNYLIDQISDGLYLGTDCTYPCKGCGLSPSICMSCAQDSIYKYLFNYTCINQCPKGYFADSKQQCQPCASQCNQCSGDAAFCTQCTNQTQFLHTKTGKCVENCPDGQFADISTKQCLDCPSSCMTCTNLSHCLTCDPSSEKIYWFSGQCLQVCPYNTIQDASNKSCLACSPNCKECRDTPDQCLSCHLDSAQPYLYGSSCQASCPSSYSVSSKDGSQCIQVQELIVPFPFLGLTVLALVIIGVIKIINKQVHFKDLAIFIVNIIAIMNWAFITYLAVVGKYWQSSIILIYALSACYILNTVWLICYFKIVRKDTLYKEWIVVRCFREFLLLFFGFLLTFQITRMVDSHLHCKKQRTYQQLFENKTRVKKLINKLSLIIICCTFFPIIVQNVYNLFYTSPQHQLFFEDIECIAITTFLLIIQSIDVYTKSKKFGNTGRDTAGQTQRGLVSDRDNNNMPGHLLQQQTTTMMDTTRRTNVTGQFMLKGDGGGMDNTTFLQQTQEDNQENMEQIMSHFMTKYKKHLATKQQSQQNMNESAYQQKNLPKGRGASSKQNISSQEHANTMNKTAASMLQNESFAQMDLTDQDVETMRSIIGLAGGGKLSASPVKPLGPVLQTNGVKGAMRLNSSKQQTQSSLRPYNQSQGQLNFTDRTCIPSTNRELQDSQGLELHQQYQMGSDYNDEESYGGDYLGEEAKQQEKYTHRGQCDVSSSQQDEEGEDDLQDVYKEEERQKKTLPQSKISNYQSGISSNISPERLQRMVYDMNMSVIPNSMEENSHDLSSQPNFEENDELGGTMQPRDSKGLKLSKQVKMTTGKVKMLGASPITDKQNQILLEDKNASQLSPSLSKFHHTTTVQQMKAEYQRDSQGKENQIVFLSPVQEVSIGALNQKITRAKEGLEKSNEHKIVENSGGQSKGEFFQSPNTLNYSFAKNSQSPSFDMKNNMEQQQQVLGLSNSQAYLQSFKSVGPGHYQIDYKSRNTPYLNDGDNPSGQLGQEEKEANQVQISETNDFDVPEVQMNFDNSGTGGEADESLDDQQPSLMDYVQQLNNQVVSNKYTSLSIKQQNQREHSQIIQQNGNIDDAKSQLRQEEIIGGGSIKDNKAINNLQKLGELIQDNMTGRKTGIQADYLNSDNQQEYINSEKTISIQDQSKRVKSSTSSPMKTRDLQIHTLSGVNANLSNIKVFGDSVGQNLNRQEADCIMQSDFTQGTTEQDQLKFPRPTNSSNQPDVVQALMKGHTTPGGAQEGALSREDTWFADDNTTSQGQQQHLQFDTRTAGLGHSMSGMATVGGSSGIVNASKEAYEAGKIFDYSSFGGSDILQQNKQQHHTQQQLQEQGIGIGVTSLGGGINPNSDSIKDLEDIEKDYQHTYPFNMKHRSSFQNEERRMGNKDHGEDENNAHRRQVDAEIKHESYTLMQRQKSITNQKELHLAQTEQQEEEKQKNDPLKNKNSFVKIDVKLKENSPLNAKRQSSQQRSSIQISSFYNDLNNSFQDTQYNSINKGEVSNFDNKVIPKKSPNNKIKGKKIFEGENSLTLSIQEQDTEELLEELEAKLPQSSPVKLVTKSGSNSTLQKVHPSPEPSSQHIRQTSAPPDQQKANKSPNKINILMASPMRKRLDFYPVRDLSASPMSAKSGLSKYSGNYTNPLSDTKMDKNILGKSIHYKVGRTIMSTRDANSPICGVRDSERNREAAYDINKFINDTSHNQSKLMMGVGPKTERPRTGYKNNKRAREPYHQQSRSVNMFAAEDIPNSTVLIQQIQEDRREERQYNSRSGSPVIKQIRSRSIPYEKQV